MTSSTLRGADILARALAAAGTRTIFSLSGNQIMPVYDAAIDVDLDIVHVRHEGAAVHMADAWGRLTGEAGIAMVTGGPGHANAVGALYTAAQSDAPLVLLSGHAPLAQLGMDAFQEMPQADIAAPLCKASWTAQAATGLDADIARAIRIARSGRPGPVHLSLPFDVLEAKVERATVGDPAALSFVTSSKPLSTEMARAIAGEIASAKRPLILAGPMLAGHRGHAVREALERASGIPVIAMESPRGVNDPALGAIAEALSDADLVVLLAKKLDFTLKFGRPPAFAAGCRFIQIDPEASALERAVTALGGSERIVLSVVADPELAAAKLAEALTAGTRVDAGWADEIRAAARFRPAAWQTAGMRAAGPLHPVEVGRAVQAAIDRAPESVLVVDGGEFGQWAQACVTAPARIINGPAGSIGSALPFALAAKRARPRAMVFALLGDGTFGFHMAEFDTAVRHNLPIVAVLGNDACWNAEHQIQLNTYGRERTFGCELLPTRYDQVVAGLGGHGEQATTRDQLEQALARAVASGKPACVNAMIERLPAPTVSRKGAAPTGGAH